MRCLGIDPGLGTLGYGIVLQKNDRLIAETYGVVRTPTELSIARRLDFLYEELAAKTRDYPPDVIAVEKLYFGRNVTTAEMVWQARGVVLLFASRLGIEPYEPKPAEMKMAVCGNGAADKVQVQGMIRYLLALDETPRPDDAADALGMAIVGLSLANNDRRLAISR